MTPIICTDVDRYKDLPLYTVKVYDIDSPVNFHSYDCFFYEQGRDLDDLLEKAEKKTKEYATNGYENGKYDASKDLPKWKKDNNNLSSLTYILDNRGDGNILLCRKGYTINIKELLNLPIEN